MSKSIARLRALVCRRQLDADMAEEMRAHLEQQTQRNVAAGMPLDDARAAANRQFGGVAQMQERARAILFVQWLDQLAHDLRFASRLLRVAQSAVSLDLLRHAR